MAMRIKVFVYKNGAYSGEQKKFTSYFTFQKWVRQIGAEYIGNDYWQKGTELYQFLLY